MSFLIPIHHPFLAYDDDWLVPRRNHGLGLSFGLGVPVELRNELWNMENDMNRLIAGLYGGDRGFERRRDAKEQLEADKDKFKVTLDVSHFKPEELTVKQEGNAVLIEGKHEERPDEHGFISRQFSRRYVLPKDVKLDAINCDLSPNGFLTLEAPKLALPAPQVRQIPICQKEKQPELQQAAGEQKGEKKQVEAAK